MFPTPNPSPGGCFLGSLRASTGGAQPSKNTRPSLGRGWGWGSGYVMISFLVAMTIVMGTLSTSLVLLWHQRDMQRLRIDRLHAEALVLSAWTWQDMNPDVPLTALPIPFSPTQLRGTTTVPALVLPIEGTAYLVQSGGQVWAVGIYGEVLEWQVRGL